MFCGNFWLFCDNSLLLQNVMLCKKKKKKKRDNPTIKGTKMMMPDIFLVKVKGNFCTLDPSKTIQNPYKIEI